MNQTYLSAMCEGGMMYNNVTDSCTICGRGTFSTSSSHYCSACPNGKDSPEGSTSITDCFHGGFSVKSFEFQGAGGGCDTTVGNKHCCDGASVSPIIVLALNHLTIHCMQFTASHSPFIIRIFIKICNRLNIERYRAAPMANFNHKKL